MAFVLVSDEGVAYVPVIHSEAQLSLCQSDPRDVAGPVKGAWSLFLSASVKVTIPVKKKKKLWFLCFGLRKSDALT